MADAPFKLKKLRHATARTVGALVKRLSSKLAVDLVDTSAYICLDLLIPHAAQRHLAMCKPASCYFPLAMRM